MESSQNIFDILATFGPLRLLVTLLCLLSPVCLVWGVAFALYKRTLKERVAFLAIIVLIPIIYLLLATPAFAGANF